MATKAEMAANMSPKFYFAMMFRASMNGFFMRFLKQVNGCVFVRVRVHARVCVDVCVNVCVDVRVDVCGVSSMASFGACVHGEASFVSREKRSSLPRPSIRLPHTTITNRDTYPPPPPPLIRCVLLCRALCQRFAVVLADKAAALLVRRSEQTSLPSPSSSSAPSHSTSTSAVCC